MKTITIGDLHGSTAWKKIRPGQWDKIVFVGDYVDSFEYSDDHILGNLQKVILFKKKYPDKVILLLGNHDLAYYFNGEGRHLCSGFRRRMLTILHRLFSDESKLFQAAFQIDNYLWTHAGVVQRWYNEFLNSQILEGDINLAATLNRLFTEYYLPLFHVSSLRGGLNDDGGIFWAHLTETLEDPLPGFHQFAGHTKTGSGILQVKSGKPDTSITFVDCLETKQAFLKLNL
jgi:hypothetical protein